MATTTGTVHPDATWETEGLDLDAYFRRIGFHGTTEPTLETLRALQRAHTDAVTFENLTSLTGRTPLLDIASLQSKIVRGGRGGYCHEQNILFGSVLHLLGFEVVGLSARILAGKDAAEMPATGHAALLVRLDGEDRLVDVGVGAFAPREPLLLRANEESTHADGNVYRVEQVDGLWLVRVKRHDGWWNIHKFSLQPFYRSDYAQANFNTAQHPRSPFTRMIIAQRAGHDARRELVGAEYTVHRPGEEPTRRTLTIEDMPSVLREDFGLEVNAEELAAIEKTLHVDGDELYR